MDERGTVLRDADLLIEGSDIAGVWPRGEADRPLEAAQVIEGAGMVAMPGMVNAHTHCAMTLLRGYADDMPLMPWLQERIWPVEGKLEAEDVYWGTQLGIAEMIRGGVTCFNDMYHYFEAAAQAALDTGMRAVVSGVLLAFLPDADKRLEQAVDFAREWKGKGDGLLGTMLGPHAPYTVPDEFLARVIEQAAEVGVGVHIHVSETAGEVEESQRDYGQTPVARLRDMGLLDVRPVVAAHCVHITEPDIAILAEKQVGVSHCPGSNMKLASGVAPVPKLLEAGATVGLGTDGPASNNNLDLLEEARLAALLHKVVGEDPTLVPAPTALEMATVGGARALGIDGSVGRLRAGMKADVVLIDMHQPHLQPEHDVVSHLVYAARSGDVRTVFINGRPMMIDGALQTIDEEAVYAEVRGRVERLLS
jgi:5-methylthioadenosine/S-adenosylhomocysteine deaminase